MHSSLRAVSFGLEAGRDRPSGNTCRVLQILLQPLLMSISRNSFRLDCTAPASSLASIFAYVTSPDNGDAPTLHVLVLLPILLLFLDQILNMKFLLF